MKVGLIPPGEPGVFRSLLLSDIADAMIDDERIIGLAVTIDNIAIGAIAALPENNRLHILSLYVAPEYRRKKAGTLLIKTMITITKNFVLGVEINYTITQEEHKTLQPFLEYLNFTKEENHYALYLTTIGLIEKKSNNLTKTGFSFSELDNFILSQGTKLAKQNYDQLPAGGLESENVDRDVSVALITDNKISAYIVIEHSPIGGLIISSIKADTCSPLELIQMFRSAFVLLKEKYPPETKLYCHVVKNEGFALLKNLLPEQTERISHRYYYSL